MADHLTATSTQVAFPTRASLRTALQAFLGTIATLGLVVPLAAVALNESLAAYLPDGWGAWLIAAGAFVAAVSAAAARIMAIPAVDAWLDRLGLASTPQGVPSTPAPAP